MWFLRRLSVIISYSLFFVIRKVKWFRKNKLYNFCFFVIEIGEILEIFVSVKVLLVIILVIL